MNALEVYGNFKRSGVQLLVLGAAFTKYLDGRGLTTLAVNLHMTRNKSQAGSIIFIINFTADNQSQRKEWLDRERIRCLRCSGRWFSVSALGER